MLRQALSVAIFCAFSASAVAAPPAAPALSPIPPMQSAGPDDRVLVIAPHPDDETLCCAGYLQRAAKNGAALGVVWITAGDSFEIDAMLVEHTLLPRGPQLQRLGLTRIDEARAAAAILGVPATQQFFLDYPDRGVAALMGEYYSRPYRSRYTRLSAVSYPRALHPGASYTGANLESDLAQVLAQFRPTIVLAAAPEDRHPDHAGSGALTRKLLARTGELGKLHYWIVHGGAHWPQPRHLHPALMLYPPALAQSESWETFALSADEQAHKLAALQQHRSQLNIMSPFLTAFVRANELFARAAD